MERSLTLVLWIVVAGCASPLTMEQRAELVEAVDQAVRANGFDPSLIKDRWLERARALVDEPGSSWPQDQRLASTINECLGTVMSHAHLHGPKKAGAEPADVLIPWVTTDDGVSVLEAVTNDRGETMTPGELVLGHVDARALRTATAGPDGQSVELRVRGVDGSERSLTWQRSTEKNDAVTSKVLPDGTFYVRINSFTGFGPFDHGNARSIESHLQAVRAGGHLIIDLRGNPGGGRSATDVSTLFFTDVKTQALFVSRTDASCDPRLVLEQARRVRAELSWWPWVTIRRLWAYLDVMDGEESFAMQCEGKGTLEGLEIAVLIDEGTRSAAEILAAFLQEECGARLIGRRSAGECAMPVTIDLPHGWSAHIPRCRIASGRGTLIEGRGLEPDVQVIHKRTDLASGRDADLERALAEVHR